ncbi:MAG TPA: hypothetical protein DCZ94_00570 [Lentisphaeria bacterium]|nr:MAG: hypothetical protein A2X48_12135 [Lentisphaerae bacterium GWF2_49_21]HBC85425.1 hypothetical protein [Lentisphaeria bacterium]
MYNWRKMTDEQRKSLLELRKSQKTPWHSPPHIQGERNRFHITAACYEHSSIIGKSCERMNEFESELLNTLELSTINIYAWVLLPNHYHVLVKTDDARKTLKALFQLHGRTSYRWNGEDKLRGRKTWYNALEHGIKSDSHFHATINYILHNPIKHSYVQHWQDWPFSNAKQYLDAIGKTEALRRWKEYDISKMGAWDV